MSVLYPLSTSLQAAQAANRGNTWLWIILFLVVVIVVWWLLTRATAHSGESLEAHGDDHGHEEAHAEVAPVASKGAARAPEPVEAPQAAVPDDLAILEGIGPKVKSLFADAGITTFAQLAAAEIDKLNEILDTNKLQFLDPTTWPEQAALAAEGKMDELQELMDNLKGGRKVD